MHHNSPNIAVVEGIVIGMNVGTYVVDLSGLDRLGTGEMLDD
jgi:hypothetical protein